MSYKKFMKRAAETQVADLSGIVGQLRVAVESDASIRNSNVSISYGVAFESLDNNVQAELGTAMENFSGTISKICQPSEITAAQHEAGVLGGVIGMNPRDFLNYRPSLEGLGAVPYEGGDAVPGRHPALESYDEKPTASTIVYNIAYNIQAARQDDFAEAFFPTIVVPPDQNGYNVSVRIASVMDDLRRQTSGALDTFNKRNLLGAAIDPSILSTDVTEIVPVYRDESAINFVDAALIAPTDTVVNGDSFKTSPLAMGKNFSLLGISQTDALLETGLLDASDSIDTALKLKNIYVKVSGVVGGQNVTEVVRFKVIDLDSATFTPVQQGQYRGMQLTFDNSSLLVNKDTKTASGAASQILAPIVSAQAELRLNAQVFGKVNLELGNTQINAGELLVVQVNDANGVALNTATGVGKTFADIFVGAQVVGYDLSARRTNLNKRQRGQLIDISYFNQIFTVPLLSPITAMRPLTQADNNDTSDLATLVSTTRILASNAGVKKLLDTATALKSFVSANDPISSLPQAFGPGRYLLAKAFFEESELDVAASVDSLTSTDRAEDVRSLLINKIRDMMYRAYAQTGYQIGADALAGGRATAPTVIIGTDPVIAQWLLVHGDFRSLGTMFETKLVTTYNKEMTGKIVMSFGRFDGSSEGTSNPLHFGNMAYKPEIVTVLPLHRNGGNSRELTVSPSFLHVVNLPVLGVINVKNLDATVLASKVTINTNP